MEMANLLEMDSRTARYAWVVRNQTQQTASTRISAWSTWFSREVSEKPLLYLLSSASSAELCAVSAESAQRGILCNDIETQPSHWPKGTQPSLPLWLASNPLCTPFDPASGDEARAIVLSALQSLYIEGRKGFFYLALHDKTDGPGLNPSNADDALRGMYNVEENDLGESALRVRLLGAGQAFQEVVAAAQLLKADWGVASQIWSCPSYTRLAREAAAAEHWNRLHPGAAKQTSHLQRCLSESADPVLAVTGYPQAVVDQLTGFVPARFVALGAGSTDARTDLRNAPAPDRHWITTLALKALADDQRLSADTVERALRLYGLR